MQLDRSAGQDAAPRVVVGNGGQAGDAEMLDETLVRAEEERPVALQRTAKHAAELVAREGRNRLVLRIEIVLRVERGVAPEFEQRSVQRVGAGSRDRVDDAAGRLAELGG